MGLDRNVEESGADHHVADAKAFIALAFDRAVWTFGTAVEADMDAAEQAMNRGKNKPKAEAVSRARQKVLDNYLDTGKAREVAEKGRYRDPALSRNRRR